jgi:hypothetical protein
MSKILVDGGAAVNKMMMPTFRRLRRFDQDEFCPEGFWGDTSKAEGVLNVELTIRSKTISTSFLVISEKGSYRHKLSHNMHIELNAHRVER